MGIDDELDAHRPLLLRAEAVLGYAFANRATLLTALTHTSYLNEHATAVRSNEVLEFLGDAVLGLVTAHALVAQTPNASEGDFTDRRSAHVSAAALLRAAEVHDLAALLRTGKGASAVVVSARADVVEALLGAVFTDGGFAVAASAAERLLGAPPRSVAAVATPHAKRELQELLQSLFGTAPSYTTARTDGPNHAPVYRAEVALFDEVLGAGDGSNKQNATQAAAEHALASCGGAAALRKRFKTKLR